MLEKVRQILSYRSLGQRHSFNEECGALVRALEPLVLELACAYQRERAEIRSLVGVGLVLPPPRSTTDRDWLQAFVLARTKKDGFSGTFMTFVRWRVTRALRSMWRTQRRRAEADAEIHPTQPNSHVELLAPDGSTPISLTPVWSSGYDDPEASTRKNQIMAMPSGCRRLRCGGSHAR